MSACERRRTSEFLTGLRQSSPGSVGLALPWKDSARAWLGSGRKKKPAPCGAGEFREKTSKQADIAVRDRIAALRELNGGGLLCKGSFALQQFVRVGVISGTFGCRHLHAALGFPIMRARFSVAKFLASAWMAVTLPSMRCTAASSAPRRRPNMNTCAPYVDKTLGDGEPATAPATDDGGLAF